ncbi:MAG TPA: diguanylate cyclase [Bacteroidota bacterium]|jgi:diguanylate cyclase (GGDEF)-like protein|nr:diguanylate cyclase [Bacteroidota bacterium]
MTGRDALNIFNRAVVRVNSSDGIIVAIGIGALILGFLVDVFLVRLICVLVVVGAGILVYAVLHSRQNEGGVGAPTPGALNNSQSQKDEMKKLVFDDFQSFPGGKYVVESDSRSLKGREDQLLALDHPKPSPSNSRLHGSPSVKPEVQSVPRDFQVSDFYDVDSAIYRGDAEPRTEFDFLLNKVLGLIKEVVIADTVAFFWANREKRQMVMEARVTDKNSFMASRRFPMGHDLVSKVAESGKPMLLSEVNSISESELLRYYDSPAAIQSFVGVPVFYSNPRETSAVEQPVAVIAIDSRVEDQFGQETLSLLGQYTKLVSALIKTYNDKYDLLLDAELLKSIRRLQEKVRNDFSMNTILQILAEETSKLVNLDFLSIVLYDDSAHAWVAGKVVNRTNESYLISQQAIEFPSSIVGETIKHNAHRQVDNLEMPALPRYFAGEKFPLKGSFVSVPVSSLNKCYGALNLESRDKYNFGRQDIEILYRLAENTASALELLYMQEVISEYVIIDDATGSYSKKFFLQRMDEELLRAEENGTELSLVFVTIDKASEIASRYGESGFERVIITLSKAVRASVRVYDIVGRHDYNRLGVMLLDTAANDAYVWAEKIRKNVSALVITLEGKSFSITISTGVCGALDGMKKEEFVGNTLAVLNKAADAGGNVVRVF